MFNIGVRVVDKELPPRARRILLGGGVLRCDLWNYLRVRGEYPK